MCGTTSLGQVTFYELQHVHEMPKETEKHLRRLS